MAAEDEDDSAKTEEPTQRRLQQAREQGQVAQSIEVKTWAGLVGVTVSVALLLPALLAHVVALSRPFLEHPEAMRLDLATAAVATAEVLGQLFVTLAPLIAVLMALGILASLAQVGLLWAPARAKPQANRLSPMAGVGRILSRDGLIEFGKGVVKVILVGVACWLATRPLLRDVGTWPSFPLVDLLKRLERAMLVLVAAATGVMALVAALDYVHQRQAFLRQMRMSRHDLQEEYKETEGDPQIKARIRKIRQARSRQRMMAAVPSATVVVTNPTHFAVALAYDGQTMPAPKVVAKGADLLAQRIRELAREHDVPLVENPPLARALYGSVEIDDVIPPEMYQAVAQIIGALMRVGRR